VTKKKLPDAVLDYFKQQGSRGGTIGSQGMTAAARTARARKAGQAAAVARTKKKHAKATKG